MKNRCSTLLAAIASVVLGGAANAQGMEGLYQPSGAYWTCSPEQIGIDGGALAIQNGVFDGVENRCDLTSPSAAGNGTMFTAVCSAEGSTYQQSMTITTTANGVSIERDGFTSFWRRCEEPQANSVTKEADEGGWGYNTRWASVSTGGDHFALSCDVFNASSTYPIAVMSVPCPTCFPMETTVYTLSVDGRFARDYEFDRFSNAEGSSSGLDYSPAWNEGLLPALKAGSVLEVLEQGNVIATFPLAGSTRAIDQLQQHCN